MGCFCFVLCVCWSGLGVVVIQLFGLFCLCLFFVSLCLFLSVSYENHGFPCNSSVLGVLKSDSLFLISVSGFCFLFLLYFLFVSRYYFVLLFCLFSCFVGNHNMIFCCFASCFLVVVFVSLLWYFCCFGGILATHQKTSLKQLEIPKTPKMKKQKKRTFWQEQLAQVCSQTVFCFLFVCFYFCMFGWKHYKHSGFSKT